MLEPAVNPTPTLPSGTVTLLFTDIEGSTSLVQRLGAAYLDVLETHRRLLRVAFAEHRGHEIETQGDSFFVAFQGAADAVAAAVAAQRSLAAYDWPPGVSLKVRIGLHSGDALLSGRNYIGLDVHRAARIAAAAHGGQVVLSEATTTLVQRSLPAGVRIRDLGEHRLKDLAGPERLYQLVVDGLPDQFPPLRTLGVARAELPPRLTSFVGRERELAQARSLLARSRLVTLTGPGGTGKTRLAVEVAARAQDLAPDGVFFVPLADLEDPKLVDSSIAHALGLHEIGRQSPREAIVTRIRDQRVLIVLDNFEQLREARGLLTELLEACPDARLLVTSRAPLRVAGEQELPVQPLPAPASRAVALEEVTRSPAVRLFADRALQVKPDFRLTADNFQAVAEITALLDGLPLAVELAASRIRLFPPEVLVEKLRHSQVLLTAGSADVPDRQRTLAAAMQWSYDLLDAQACRLLSRLAVFVGSALLDDIEPVCNPDGVERLDVLPALEALVEQNLVRPLPDVSEARFSMLQLIRRFAHDKLERSAEATAIERAHAQRFHDLAVEAEHHLLREAQTVYLDRLERDHDNLRAALNWLTEHGEPQAAASMAAALWRFWQMRGHLQEGRERIERVLERHGAHLDDKTLVAVLDAVGGIAYWQGHEPQAIEYYSRCVAIGERIGDRKVVADAYYNLAFAVPNEEGLNYVHKAADAYREIGDELGLALALAASGDLRMRSTPDEAIPPLREAKSLLAKREDRYHYAWALDSLGTAYLTAGKAQEAESEFLAALEVFAAARDLSGLALVIDDVAAAALACGDAKRAVRLSAAAAKLTTLSGAELFKNAARAPVERMKSSGLAEAEAAAEWAAGRALTIDEVVEYARQPACAERH